MRWLWICAWLLVLGLGCSSQVGETPKGSQTSASIVGSPGADSRAEDAKAPSTTPRLEGIVDIAAASNTSCALSSTGDVYCWGAPPGYADLPDDWTTNHPRKVVGLDHAVELKVTDGAAFARQADGKILTWGAYVSPFYRVKPEKKAGADPSGESAWVPEELDPALDPQRAAQQHPNWVIPHEVVDPYGELPRKMGVRGPEPVLGSQPRATLVAVDTRLRSDRSFFVTDQGALCTYNTAGVLACTVQREHPLLPSWHYRESVEEPGVVGVDDWGLYLSSGEVRVVGWSQGRGGHGGPENWAGGGGVRTQEGSEQPPSLEAFNLGGRLQQVVTSAFVGVCTMALLEDGSVVSWPKSAPEERQKNEGLLAMQQIDAGLDQPHFGCGVTLEGQVQCFSPHCFTKQARARTRMPSPPPPSVLPGITGAKKVAVGEAHYCVLTDDGHVWCGGNNAHGQCGRGVTTGPESDLEPAGVVAPRKG